MIPYACPVCSGKGRVPSGFYEVTRGLLPGGLGYYYSGSTCDTGEVCRSCNAAGIVWWTPAPVLPPTPFPPIQPDAPFVEVLP